MNDSSHVHSGRFIAHDDARRLAAFFDHRMSAVYAFVRAVWLPDAMITLQKLARAISSANEHDVVFLCDHLREGARSVGAHAYIADASLIESSFEAGEPDRSEALIRSALLQLAHADAWLARRAQPRRRRSALVR